MVCEFQCAGSLKLNFLPISLSIMEYVVEADTTDSDQFIDNCDPWLNGANIYKEKVVSSDLAQKSSSSIVNFLSTWNPTIPSYWPALAGPRGPFVCGLSVCGIRSLSWAS